ncbi:MAG: Uma2 family endonuclease [Oscillospiraceae bacterium]|nr:Uma2 family endonuclease [Oscillospiraceae bacterium]
MEALRKDQRYTYMDYCSWDNDVRYELIDGKPYAMAPPLRRHQSISMDLSRQIANFLHGKTCEVYSAPFAVRLNANEGDDTVVEPDITVICDHSKLDDRGCKGVPDLIIEILSPSSSRYDKIIKFNKYREAGVREYWIVDPDDKSVQVCVLKDNEYMIRGYIETDNVAIGVLDGCTINLSDVFSA